MDKSTIIETLNHAYFSETPDEDAILRHFPGLLKNARSFVDLGASLGQFTKLANTLIINGEILAVEADPLRFEELSRNCAKWQSASTNKVRALHAAVAAQPGELKFQVTNSCVSGGLLRHELRHLDESLKAEVHWEEVPVKAVTLDSLFPNEVPDFVKMDIEGAELMALQGARRILSQGRTAWFIELHDFALTDGKKTSILVHQVMKDAGYSRVDLDLGTRCLYHRLPWSSLPALTIQGWGWRIAGGLKRLAKKMLGRA